MKLTITQSDVPTILAAFNLPKDTQVVFCVDQPRWMNPTSAELRSKLLSMPYKLDAIKVVREVFGCGLKEAKDLIDGMWER